MNKKQSFKEYSNSKKFFCCVTGELIQPARVEYLLGEGVPEYNLTSLKGANATHRPRKIIVVDDEGTEFLCDKIDETRAWESERFGSESGGEPDCWTLSDRKATKRTEEAPISLLKESLDVVIKKQDTGDEEEEELL